MYACGSLQALLQHTCTLQVVEHLLVVAQVPHDLHRAQQFDLSDADCESFALFNLVGRAADGPCPVKNFAGVDVLEIKRCKLARVAEGGLVGRQPRKLKLKCHHILGFLFCAQALQLLQVRVLHTHNKIKIWCVLCQEPEYSDTCKNMRYTDM